MQKPMKKMSIKEAAVRLLNCPIAEGFDFCETYNEETEEAEWHHRIEKIRFADSIMVIANYYGGSAPFMYDLTEDTDTSELEAALRHHLTDQIGIPDLWVDAI